MIKKILLLIIFTPALCLPALSLAQEGALPPEDFPFPRINVPVTGLPNTVNCFDYYKFGSVQADIYSDTRSVVSGTEMIFKGEVVNNNTYPIVDGAVYVKIFGETPRSDESVHINGYPVIDQFFAVEDLHVDANSKKDISFKWSVPSYAVSGKYHIATFFVTSKKFNLLGLSFIDDIVGNKFDFEIKGEAQGGVSFDKDSVAILCIMTKDGPKGLLKI